jgi:hypothetical protein
VVGVALFSIHGQVVDSIQHAGQLPSAGFIGLSERSKEKEGTICCFVLIDYPRNRDEDRATESTH